jgi:hypothetical protein
VNGTRWPSESERGRRGGGEQLDQQGDDRHERQHRGELVAQQAAEGGSATEMDLLRAEVHHYGMLCGEFRKQAKKALDLSGS